MSKESTAVQSCWTWVKRAFILPIRYTCRVPGGDYEGYVDAHVRRLEALRRAGIVERIDADQWRIPDDLVSRAAAHDAGRDSQASVRVLSPV
ncbi:DUF3363 domain-containing protein, partial [Escherichia coli]